jgi:hypothetical protein
LLILNDPRPAQRPCVVFTTFKTRLLDYSIERSKQNSKSAKEKQNDLTMSDANIQASGDFIDLHELAKGWKAAIARANDPATR